MRAAKQHKEHRSPWGGARDIETALRVLLRRTRLTCCGAKLLKKLWTLHLT